MMFRPIKRLVKQTLYKNYLNNRGRFPYYGEEIFFPKNSTTFHVAFSDPLGIYEGDNLRFILGNVKEDSVYLDIGANIGLMSIPVLKEFANVKVVSVEASPTTFKYLNSTWDKSKFKDRWHVLNKAVSNVSGEIDFHVAKSSHGAYESIQNTGRTEFASVIKVQSVTIDEVWQDLKSPYISFIKSDIEGADLLAIKGGAKCIAQCRPVILMEWNAINIVPFNFRNSDLLDLCKTIGYSCYAVPTLVKIGNIGELAQNGLVTENFILIPDA